MTDRRRLTLTLGEAVPLALRFWDPVLDAPVGDGLLVCAWPAGGPAVPVAAVRSGAGVYLWPQLPGWRGRRPGQSLACVVSVRDRQERFLPVTLRLAAPDTAPGWLLSQPPGPDGAPRRITLLSAPSRSAPTGFAAVRGQLWDAGAGAPAAHALVSVAHNGLTAWAVADRCGRFAALFPYPVFRAPLRAGPAPPPPAWRLRLGVRYGGLPPPPPGADGPDWQAVAAQPPAALLPGDGAAAEQIDLVLTYGRELVVRSGQGSTLLLRPGGATGPR